MAWELTFFQGINNGDNYEEQAAVQCYLNDSCMRETCVRTRLQDCTSSASTSRQPGSDELVADFCSPHC